MPQTQQMALKVFHQINTALQLLLMGLTTVSPLLTIPVTTPLSYLQ